MGGMMRMKLTSHNTLTSGRRELKSVDFTETHRKYTWRRGRVAEPITAILSHGSVNADHKVVVAQHLPETYIQFKLKYQTQSISPLRLFV